MHLNKILFLVAGILTLVDTASLDEISWKTSYGVIPEATLYQLPRIRYWFPGGWIEPEEVSAEIRTIAAAGFGGVEIGDVRDSISMAMDTALYGWGQSRWNSGVLAAYDTAVDEGIHVDYTLGPQWPTGVPGYTPDSPETAKELVHGVVLVSAGDTFSGTLPTPSVKPSGVSTANPFVKATLELVACLAARTNVTTVKHSQLDFDPSKVLDLTAAVTNNYINWTAPTDSSYLLVSIYGRGTGQIQSQFDGNPHAPNLTDPSPAYIVDHFSRAGVEASVNYWNTQILTDELRAVLQLSQGSLFEDSLELEFKQYWTNNLIQEFKDRRGYDLTKYLLYIVKDTNIFVGDLDISRRVNYDFNTTITDLYNDYRITGLKEFANSIGLKFRAQANYYTIDWSRAAANLDIPEGDYSSAVDGWRIHAAGRDIAGQTAILSEEVGAISNKAYGTLFRTHLSTINSAFALGVNQVVLHGFPYRDAPDSHWPGFHAFTPHNDGQGIGYSEAWGTRQPQWLFANNISAYLGRAQYIQQSGTASVDVAILDPCWDVSKLWTDTGLAKAGFSYQFPSPALLLEHNASVANHRLVPEGPQYKALVINYLSAMNIDIAEAILSWGTDGLPIVLVGDAPNSTRSFSETIAADDEQLQRIWTSILGLQTTIRATNQSETPAALYELGVLPSITYKQASEGGLTAFRRRTSDNADIYWLASSDTDSYTVSLEGSGVPYRLNLWTGVVSPIGLFSVSDGYISLNVSIASGAAESIYIGSSPPFGAQVPSKYATSASVGAEIFIDSNNDLNIRSGASGTYTVITSDGENSTVTFKDVPPEITLSAWNLTVEDWNPTDINATGIGSSDTSKTILAPVSLSKPVAWSSVPAIASAAGIGIYSTSFEMPALNSTTIPPSVGAYLVMPSITGTWGVKVNGYTVEGCDQFSSQPLELSSYLRNGENEITITVATPLWNKLRSIWSFYASAAVMKTGMTGSPVVTFFHRQNL